MMSRNNRPTHLVRAAAADTPNHDDTPAFCEPVHLLARRLGGIEHPVDVYGVDLRVKEELQSCRARE